MLRRLEDLNLMEGQRGLGVFIGKLNRPFDQVLELVLGVFVH